MENNLETQNLKQRNYEELKKKFYRLKETRGGKKKLDGKVLNYKPKENESYYVLKWIDEQTNFTDAVRFLIEKEILENGFRNLMHFIPGERNLDYHLENDILFNFDGGFSSQVSTQKFVEQAVKSINSTSDVPIETKTVNSLSEMDIETAESKSELENKNQEDNTVTVEGEDEFIKSLMG